MAILLNGNDTNRLVEVLAGSTVLLNDSSASGALPPFLDTLLSDEAATTDAPADAATAHAVEGDPAVPAALLDPVTDLADHSRGTDTSHLLGIGDVLHLGSNSQFALAAAAEPMFDAGNGFLRADAPLDTLADRIDVPALGHATTALDDTAGLGTAGSVPPASVGHANLLGDLLNAPSTLLHGGLDDVIAHIGGDLGDTLNGAGSIVSALLDGSGALGSVSGLLGSLGDDLQQLPLLNLAGGEDGLLGSSPLTGLLGNLAGSAGHLISVDPAILEADGFNFDLMSTSGNSAAHTSGLDIGPNGPQVLDLAALSGGMIDVPGLGGAGTDALTGHLLGDGGLVEGLLGDQGFGHGLFGGDVASGNAVSTPISTPLDIAALSTASALTGDHGVLDLHGAHIL